MPLLTAPRPTVPSFLKSDPLANRRLQVGLCDSSGVPKLVASKVFAPGSSITLGGGATASVRFEGWDGVDLLLISRGTLLHLGPQMRLDMCDDDGSGRVAGTFEELSAKGMDMPIRVRVCKLNVKVGSSISAFVRYLADGEFPRPEFFA
jgi:hypothetical protein